VVSFLWRQVRYVERNGDPVEYRRFRMADKTYDAIIVGGGNKGLVTALYLAKYGGMKVGVFESRHELGGGWASEESPAPGFIANTHCDAVNEWYLLPLERDFPVIKDYWKYIPHAVVRGAAFNNDTGFSIHSSIADPTQANTAKSLESLSARDAETWLKLYEEYRKILQPAILEEWFNPPTPPGMPSPMEKLRTDPRIMWDQSWIMKSELDVLRDLFENDQLIGALVRLMHSAHGMDPEIPGGSMMYFTLLHNTLPLGCWEGGTHSAAHACQKILAADGAETFTHHEVDNVLIENGQATGVRLVDGTEIAARTLVVSNLDPYTLCFQLIGKEHISSKILRKVEYLVRWHICITWYTWALHEPPQYKAGNFDPGVLRASRLALGPEDPEMLGRNAAWRRLGKVDPELNIVVRTNSWSDPTQMPDGKVAFGTEDFVPPANALTEGEWLEFKKFHAQETLGLWQKFAPNMTWDNIIGYAAETPYDCCRLKNMAPYGNWAIIDHMPGQMGRNRPIPELAFHRVPEIKGLYATGSAWHPGGGGFSSAGYNCYKVIAQDYGLDKPWEKANHPW
jgi:phytoene dehydrogenase-like protein